MAFPWYSAEFPVTNFSETTVNVLSPENVSPPQSTKNSRNKKSSTKDNTNFISMSAVRNIVIPTNHIFKMPELDIDKISSSEEADDGHHRPNHVDDYSGHDYYHTGLINKAFFPMRVVLTAVGRWPFLMKLTAVSSRTRKRNKAGLIKAGCGATGSLINTKIRNYDDNLRSPLWIYFGVTTLFILFVLIMSTVSFFDFFLEWELLPKDHWKPLEKDIFQNNLVVFLVVWGCLVHSTVSSFSLFINRRKVARILNFWNVAADELCIDEVKSHRRFLIASNMGYMLFLVLIYFSFSIFNIRLIQDGARLFGILSLRPLFNEEQITDAEDWKLQIFGIVTIIYVIYASRAYLFLFCFKCRLLRSLFRVWNARLIKYLRKPEVNLNGLASEKQELHETLDKLECGRLLNDMIILLKMIKQMDKTFATVLQAYYGVQLLNMCFELYMLAKSGSTEFTRNDEDNRGWDIITAVLVLCQNIYFFFTVSLDGAYVGEEAAKGHEALRRHPISPEASIQKKYLEYNVRLFLFYKIYNLSFIYNQPIALTGGKYFTVNRPFIITVLGAVLTYFVIIMQVEPSLQKNGYTNNNTSR